MMNTHYFRLGLFILTGLAIVFAGLIFFGAGHLFSKSVLVETYFDESVQGLDVGSDVKYRGVKIGRVSEIGFVQNTYAITERTPEQLRAMNYVRVVCQIDANLFADNAKFEVLDRMVASGLRLRATTQGITGTLLLQADYIKTASDEVPPCLPIFWQPVHYYVPSAPTVIKELSDSLKHVFNRVNKFDIEGGVKQFTATLEAIETGVEKLEVEKISKELQSTLVAFRKTCDDVQRVLNDERVNQLLTASTRTLEHVETLTSDKAIPQIINSLNQTSSNLAILTANLTNSVPDLMRNASDALARQDQGIDAAVTKMREALDELNALLKMLKADPSSLIFSKPPASDQL